jgi:AcrR family transcriptional regulator
MMDIVDAAEPAPADAIEPAPAKRPAHRPSRRRQILEAATKMFAQEGYIEANVEDIARAAGVAPTAIYYHFGGKEELFTQTLRAAMNAFSEQVYAVRSDDEPGTIESLRAILRTGWEYWRTNPDAARLVARYSEGSTVQALRIRREWEDRHLARAYDYVPASRSTRSNRRAREQHAANALAIRVMLDVILASQAAALDGTLGRVPRAALIEAVEEMCVALIMALD